MSAEKSDERATFATFTAEVADDVDSLDLRFAGDVSDLGTATRKAYQAVYEGCTRAAGEVLGPEFADALLSIPGTRCALTVRIDGRGQVSTSFRALEGGSIDVYVAMARAQAILASEAQRRLEGLQ